MKRVRVEFVFEIPTWSADPDENDPPVVAEAIAEALNRMRWGIRLEPGDVTVEEIREQVAT